MASKDMQNGEEHEDMETEDHEEEERREKARNSEEKYVRKSRPKRRGHRII